MSDKHDEKTSGPRKKRREPAKDWDLEIMVGLADASVLHDLDIVLMLAGQTVGGRLIGGREFYDTLANNVTGASDPTGASGDQPDGTLTLPGLLSKFGSTYNPEGNAKEAMLDVHFVHLKDVLVLNPERPISLGLWRGRLKDVTGWSLGRADL